MLPKTLAVLFLIISFSILSCRHAETSVVVGDLNFKHIELFKTFDMTDKDFIKFETAIKNQDTTDEQNKNIYKTYQFLVSKNLLRSPFVHIKLDNGQKMILYLSPTDYQPFKTYSLNALLSENKKIRIKADVEVINHEWLSAYITKKIISLDKIDGTTEWTK